MDLVYVLRPSLLRRIAKSVAAGTDEIIERTFKKAFNFPRRIETELNELSKKPLNAQKI